MKQILLLIALVLGLLACSPAPAPMPLCEDESSSGVVGTGIERECDWVLIER